MSRKRPYARIAITLPQETLHAADELAARHDRSRSWIVAEAIRVYAVTQQRGEAGPDALSRLGHSRLEQLRRDVALSPQSRVRESEELAALGPVPGEVVSPRTFASFDEFLAWRRRREER